MNPMPVGEDLGYQFLHAFFGGEVGGVDGAAAGEGADGVLGGCVSGSALGGELVLDG